MIKQHTAGFVSFPDIYVISEYFMDIFHVFYGHILLYILSTSSSTLNSDLIQRYTYRVLQTIQIELILLCVWAEQAILGSAKIALKFKYEI